MKITRITVFRKDLPLEHPYWLSGGRLKFDVLDATFVKLETDEGLTGWGEGTPWGHTYVPAHGPGIRAGIETMAPFVLRLDPRNVRDIERAMGLALPGHLYAKSPIDMACWDIAGQAAGRNIADLLGGGRARPHPLRLRWAPRQSRKPARSWIAIAPVVIGCIRSRSAAMSTAILSGSVMLKPRGQKASAFFTMSTELGPGNRLCA